MFTVELPLSRVRELGADPEIVYLSANRTVKSFGHLETTTAAAQARSLGGSTSFDGSGIGIAIIDSGIDTNHNILKPGGVSHVVHSQDFTGDTITGDTYGHGTFVASLAAGSSAFAGGAYTGVAPGANLLSLRVLDDNGAGTSSNLISAIDWCVTYKDTYNIRVINMSLGTPAVDSYQFDPLCLAARRAHDAGIVVVCAAGNVGKDEFGGKLYGGIHSPGIEPSVITVGATKTFGTDERSDDAITSYSSHGPTRGYYTEANGDKHYDNLIKPDLVAPGNKLIGAQSVNPRNASLPNIAMQISPQLETYYSSDPASKMMYMSGTSMSSPVVAGAAALLLQANPTLTPNLVKAILMYTAQPHQRRQHSGTGCWSTQRGRRDAGGTTGPAQCLLAGQRRTDADQRAAEFADEQHRG